jgi:succinate dehydrogenase / fumarate reductase, cytochrome b subunit
VQITNDPGLTSLADRLGVTLQVMNDHDVIATAGSFGTATLLNVRDTFKSISNCLLYTFLVVATCFHAMNGLWTMTITWGIALTERSRLLIRRVCNGLMFLLLFLGLAAIWGTYWINLKS